MPAVVPLPWATHCDIWLSLFADINSMWRQGRRQGYTGDFRPADRSGCYHHRWVILSISFRISRCLLLTLKHTHLYACVQTRYSDHSMRQWRNKIVFIQKICQIASKGLFTPKQVSGTKNWYDLAKQSVFECDQIMVLCNCSVTGHVTKTTNHIGRPIFFAVQ